MSEICSTCGLPKELCACEVIAKEDQNIVISIIRKKFGKRYTVVEGLDAKQINLKDLTKDLKSKLACGGSAKNGILEFQGDHKQKIKESLIENGFAPETIKIEDGFKRT